MKKLALVALVLLNTSCATLNPIDQLNPLKPDKGIETTVQLGKENHTTKNKALAQVDSQSTTTTTNDNNAEVINQTYETIPPWIIILVAGLAGLAIDKPFDSSRRRYRRLLDRLVDERLSLNGKESNNTPNS